MIENKSAFSKPFRDFEKTAGSQFWQTVVSSCSQCATGLLQIIDQRPNENSKTQIFYLKEIAFFSTLRRPLWLNGLSQPPLHALQQDLRAVKGHAYPWARASWPPHFLQLRLFIYSTPWKKVSHIPIPSRDVTYQTLSLLFPPMGSLVSDIPAGDGNVANLFYSVHSYLVCGHLCLKMLSSGHLLEMKRQKFSPSWWLSRNMWKKTQEVLQKKQIRFYESCRESSREP